MSTRVRHAIINVEIVGDETARHVEAYPHDLTQGQAQIGAPLDTFLHITGTPEAWRHLAKVIEDAAMELERQISEQAVAS